MIPMQKLTSKSALVFFISIGLLGCGGPNQPAASGKLESESSPAHAPAIAPAQSGVNYGQEVSRKVYRPDEIVSVLKNGMVVIAKKVPSPVVSVRAYVMAGGIYEKQWLGGGLSHLLEHLVAGGSNQRRSELENLSLLQAVGNDSNAYTTFDHTAYFVNTTAEHLDQAVDLVSGWVLGAKITPEEYTRERQVVQRELEMGKGEPDRVFEEAIERNRYHVSPARVPVIGYQAVIQGISRDDVYAYYKLAYQPNNMVFAVAGDLDPEKMLQSVERYVADAPPGRVFSHTIEEEPPVLAPRTLVQTFPKLGQARLELGFPTIKLTNPDLYALDLLATVLARGDSSILAEQVRDTGLVSGISADDQTPEYVQGTFGIDMELDSAKIPAATKAVLGILDQIKKEGVPEDRLKAAKTQMKASRAYSLQTAEQIVESMADDYMSTGDPHFSDQYVERIQQVTSDQLKAVAAKYLSTRRMLTTCLLPQESMGKDGLAGAEAMLRKLTQPTEAQASAAKSSDVHRLVMKDGTIVLLKRVASSPMVVINLYALGGITAEDPQTNGLGSLTMMTVPRGTKTRSAQQIAEFFDSVGGDIETLCGNNTWNWQSICLRDDFPKTIEVFADLVKNPSFPDDQVNPIRQRLLAAIEEQDANWRDQAMRFFRKTYFSPRNEPYQFTALGTSANVSKFTPAQMRQWYENKVLKGKRVLAVYGDIDPDKAQSLIAAQFGGIETSAPAAPASNSSPSATDHESAKPSIDVREVAINPSHNPQAGVFIGFDADPVIGAAEQYPLTVADTLCSGYGYPTGYIFETLRGKGLVYDANAMIFSGQSSKLPGTFIVYAGCDPKNVNAVIDDILLNMARLQGSAEDIQPQWFDRAKKLIVTADAMNNETAAAQAQTAALDELFGLGFDYHAHFADSINAVRLPSVQDVARRRLRSCVITVTTSAPDQVQVRKGPRTYDSFPPVDLTPKGVTHDSGAAGH